jgi:hypothetical protein
MPSPGSFLPGDVLTADDLNAIGAWTSYTPVLAQSGTRTATVNYAEYSVINKVCFVNVDLTCTTTGSAGNAITVTLPFTAASTAGAIGAGQFFDSSATDIRLLVVQSSTTLASFVADDSTNDALGATPSVALGNNDVISFSIMYQVA